MPMAKIKKHLSKSQYTRGLQCIKSLWLYNYKRELEAEVSDGTQATFDQGHEVGALAREYFKGGVLLKNNRDNIPGALKETQDLLAAGETILYEPAFQAQNVLAFCDILRKAKDGWELIEVKSTTKLKDQHLGDIAIQKYVIEKAGIKIKRAYLMYVNNEFVRSGPVTARDLFTLQEVTEEIKEAVAAVPATLKKFFAALAKPGKEPAIKIGGHCSDPYPCDFQGHCWKDIPSYSAYNFARLKEPVRAELIRKGILAVKDFPATLELSETQQDFVDVAKSGKPLVRKPELKEFLASLAYPLYHVDFETYNPAIPLYDGQRPFQPFPFQVSLHIEQADGKLQHYEYLGDGKKDPREDIADFLIKHIGPKGTPIAYSAGTEKGVIRGLAGILPRKADKLLALAERFADLAKPFRSRYYMHPAFEGGYSMKVVLPTLVPGMKYEGMAVSNGTDAQAAFAAMASGKLTPAEAAQKRTDLLAYCKQDTLAMVKVLDYLKKL